MIVANRLSGSLHSIRSSNNSHDICTSDLIVDRVSLTLSFEACLPKARAGAKKRRLGLAKFCGILEVLPQRGRPLTDTFQVCYNRADELEMTDAKKRIVHSHLRSSHSGVRLT